MKPALPQSGSGKGNLPAHPLNSSDGEFSQRSRVALEAANVGTWSWEPGSDTVMWDEVMHRLFGVTPDEFSCRLDEIENLIHPKDRERIRTETTRTYEAGAKVDCEFRVVWPSDGSTHAVRVRGKSYQETSDQPVKMTGACWDITQRKAVQEELAHERFLLRTLMAHMPDKIYFKDTESRFLCVSDALGKWFGEEDAAAVVGKSDFDYFQPEHAQQAFEDEQRIIRTGQPMINFQEKETWPDGHVTWVATTKLPLTDPQGRVIGTFGLSRDITDRLRAEEQLEKYANELRKKNEELEEDLEMARELQNALIPRHYPCFPSNANPRESAVHFSHFFNPSTAVSGDFFDILELSNSSAGLFICDVMGHGVRAALVASIVRALVRELLPIGEAPGEFLKTLNRKLTGILKQSEIPVFATASYVVADLAKGELRYANAGHPAPLRVRHSSKAANVSVLDHCRRGPVMGVFDGAQYGETSSTLSPQDLILLFTDGLYEVEGASGNLYDEHCLLGAVSRRVNLGAGELCQEVLTEIRQFSANKEFSDDVCLVSMEVERVGVEG